MQAKFKDITLNFESYGNSKNLIFFIHGFAGSSRDWSNVIPEIDKRFNPIAIDLIGHGKSDSPEDLSFYTQESLTEQINFIIDHLTSEKVILVGYSMGGRAALSFAADFPEKIKGLILESSSSGISSEDVRIQRIQSDFELAAFILNNPIEKFVDHWMNIDLFKSQKYLPKELIKRIRADKLINNKSGLANSLKGFSTGKMTPLFTSLKNINVNTLLITGSLDQKFTTINSEMVSQFPSARHKIVENAGHNVHLENPREFISLVNNFLKEF